jgi:hypothetical protein
LDLVVNHLTAWQTPQQSEGRIDPKTAFIIFNQRSDPHWFINPRSQS